MLKKYADIFRRSMILVDLCLAAAVFFLSYWLRDHFSGTSLWSLDYYIKLCPIVAVLWGVSLYSMGMYRSFRLKSALEILWTIIKAALIAFILFTAVMYVFKIVNISRSFIILGFVLTTLVISIEKYALFFFFKAIRRQGFNFRNILVVGTNKRAQRFIWNLDTHRDLGLKVVGVIDEDEEMVGRRIGGHEVIGTIDDLAQILATQVVDQVVVIVPRSMLNKIEPLVHHCETIGTTVSVATDLFNPKFAASREESVLGLPLMTFQTVSDKVGQLLFKRAMDIIISGTLIILTMPLYLVIALLIKMTSKGPVYFAQERCGLQGRKFKLYKFRTMVVDAEAQLKSLMDKNEMSGPVFKIKEDPRITPLGKFLRKWSLDELPQLWNILQGSMSLVGPRPPIPREVNEYDYWQRRRLSMRPGLTGLWQVSGRNNISNFDEWVKLDLRYMDNWSLKEDVKILMRTVPAVFKTTGAR
jgi:exopolysaccharide biosynthesis polyprenyl glycosylphosphotransferase